MARTKHTSRKSIGGKQNHSLGGKTLPYSVIHGDRPGPVPVSSSAMQKYKKVPLAVKSARVGAHKSTTKRTRGTNGAYMKFQQPRKFRAPNGTVALREIRHHQANGGRLIPKGPFQRLVRECTAEFKNDIRFRPEALEAIQLAAEAYSVDLLEQAQLAALHAKRTTIKPADLALVRRLRGEALFDD
ncbi:hypothetical protein CC1G_04034 [Coprinopsis cinerea okayama7|uniref:Core Histone H2A/H2B/H3 domain-containing protein n=1 Tax=Coprinopsis cinerea (strain Okayama-7 / 130 / ATCC MYA-4618 / FGSC 9003) TaxID=240176 RepID=A8N8I7_COPC7|nr:hypothetical protein CC1G_04034 [Coprinopsis cinerea okayama7\|eukprot:XP_001831143.2 hypothetical protein CC1G_04034 [Coprinopsis cinerea okayama7\